MIIQVHNKIERKGRGRHNNPSADPSVWGKNDEDMKVTRKSIVSGIERTLELDITPEQLQAVENKDEKIQVIVPHLSEDEREFLLTGMWGDEWDTLMSEDDDDEEYQTTDKSEGGVN